MFKNKVKEVNGVHFVQRGLCGCYAFINEKVYRKMSIFYFQCDMTFKFHSLVWLRKQHENGS